MLFRSEWIVQVSNRPRVLDFSWSEWQDILRENNIDVPFSELLTTLVYFDADVEAAFFLSSRQGIHLYYYKASDTDLAEDADEDFISDGRFQFRPLELVKEDDVLTASY